MGREVEKMKSLTLLLLLFSADWNSFSHVLPFAILLLLLLRGLLQGSFVSYLIITKSFLVNMFPMSVRN